MSRTCFEDAQKDFLQAIATEMREAAAKADVPIVLEGLGVGVRSDALIAGVPTPPHSQAIGFLYFDVPGLGQCSQLLRPDFYAVELLRAPYWDDVRARLTSSDGRKVIVTDVEIQPIPAGATAPQQVSIDLGENHGTACIGYSNDFPATVYVKVSDSGDI